MLWYKAWLECRFRLILSASLIIWFAISGSMNLLAKNQNRGSLNAIATSDTAKLFAIVVVALPMSALILAGSGINSQTNWGMTQGLHPSTWFTLSLPVSRARLLWTRAGLGWIFLAGLTLLALLVANLTTSARLSFNAFASLLIGCTVFYMLALWLSTFLDEMWTGMVSLTVTGMLTGYSLAGGPGWLNIFGFLKGQRLQWESAMFYLALSCVLAFAAWFNIRRKQY